MNEDYVEPDTRASRSLGDVLVADRWRILGILLLAGAGAVFFGWNPSVPRWLHVTGLAFGAAALLGYAPAARLVKWLYKPSYTYLVDVDARTNEFAVWQLPPDVWRDLEVLDGELYEVRSTAPAWECRGYDPEANEATGTWRGSASDLEFIEDRERIDEIRGVLEDLAKEGLTYRVKQSGIVRSAVRGIVLSFIEGFESETLYEGSAVKDSVDDALARWQFENSPRDDSESVGDDGTNTEANQRSGQLAEEGRRAKPDHPTSQLDRDDTGGLA